MKKIYWLFIFLFVFAVMASPAFAAPKVIAAKLHADWCGTCKKMAPTFTQLKSEFGDQVMFVKFDRTDENSSKSSMMLANALGISKVYNAAEGTGKILLINPKSKKLIGTLNKAHSPEKMSMLLEMAVAGKAIDTGSGGMKGSGMKDYGGSGKGSMKKGSGY